MLFTEYQTLVVEQIDIKSSPTAFGKDFNGDYAKSSSYIVDLIAELSGHGIETIPAQTIAVYYDDPSQKPADQLMSFQGVFVSQLPVKIPDSFMPFVFKGQHLYVKNSGPDVMKIIFEAYTVLFDHIKKNHVKLESPAGYQVLTYTGDAFVAEILMKLE